MTNAVIMHAPARATGFGPAFAFAFGLGSCTPVVRNPGACTGWTVLVPTADARAKHDVIVRPAARAANPVVRATDLATCDIAAVPARGLVAVLRPGLAAALDFGLATVLETWLAAVLEMWVAAVLEIWLAAVPRLRHGLMGFLSSCVGTPVFFTRARFRVCSPVASDLDAPVCVLLCARAPPIGIVDLASVAAMSSAVPWRGLTTTTDALEPVPEPALELVLEPALELAPTLLALASSRAKPRGPCQPSEARGMPSGITRLPPLKHVSMVWALFSWFVTS